MTEEIEMYPDEKLRGYEGSKRLGEETWDKGVGGKRGRSSSRAVARWRVPFLVGRRDAFRVERRQHRDALSFPRTDGMAARPIVDAAFDACLQHGSDVRSATRNGLTNPAISNLATILKYFIFEKCIEH